MTKKKKEDLPQKTDLYPWVDEANHKIIPQTNEGEQSILEEPVKVRYDWGQSWGRANIIEPFGLWLYAGIYAIIVYFLMDRGTGNYDASISALMLPIIPLILNGFNGKSNFYRALFFTILVTVGLIIPFHNEGLIEIEDIWVISQLLTVVDFVTPYLNNFNLFEFGNLNSLTQEYLLVGVIVGFLIIELVLLLIYALIVTLMKRNKQSLFITNKYFYFIEKEKTTGLLVLKALIMMLVSPLEFKKHYNRFRYIRKQLKYSKGQAIFEYARLGREDISDLTKIYKSRTNRVIFGILCFIPAVLLIIDYIDVVDYVLFGVVPLNYIIALVPIAFGLYFIIKKPSDKVTLKLNFEIKNAEGSLIEYRKYSNIALYNLKKEISEYFKAEKEIIKSPNYEDYYITKNGKPVFDIYSYRYMNAGARLDKVAFFVILLIGAVFIGFGLWNLYYLIIYVEENYFVGAEEYIEIIGYYLQSYGPYVIYALVGIWLITLMVSYFIVRLFGQLAAIFMYGSVILQIGFYGYLFYKLSGWEYHWIFLIPLALQVLVLTVWHKKLKLAIKFVKISSKTVVKLKGMVVAHLFQTMWVIGLSVLHFAITAVTFLHIHDASIMIFGYTINNTDTWVYAIICVFFVFLMYMVIFATLGIKMLMVHEYYRGGRANLFRSMRLVLKRWWQLMIYAFSSTIIHTIQFLTKLFKGEVKVTNLVEAASLTTELAPINPMAFDKEKTVIESEGGKPKTKKKKMPIYERIWFGLNYFTLPAVIIRDQKLLAAMASSVKLIVTKMADLYIKKSNVNKLFRLMQWVSIFLSGVVGAVIGAVLGKYFGFSDAQIYVIAGASAGLFYWIAGFTAAMILNDLNMTYIEVLYIYCYDRSNNRKGYSRFELKDADEIEKEFQKELEKQAEKEKKKESKRKKSKSISNEEIVTQLPQEEKPQTNN